MQIHCTFLTQSEALNCHPEPQPHVLSLGEESGVPRPWKWYPGGPNPRPSCCDAAMLSAAPSCCPYMLNASKYNVKNFFHVSQLMLGFIFLGHPIKFGACLHLMNVRLTKEKIMYSFYVKIYLPLTVNLSLGLMPWALLSMTIYLSMIYGSFVPRSSLLLLSV